MTVLVLFAGLAAGAVAGWFACIARGRGAPERAASSAEASRALAEERLGEIERQRGEIATLRAAAESEHRARVLAESALTHSRESALEQRAILDDAREQLSSAFESVSADVLARSTTRLLDVATDRFAQEREATRERLGQVVGPLAETLATFDTQVREIEASRATAYGALSEQLRELGATQHTLQSETRLLAQALRSPTSGGRWGELQLRRVVELAGMVEHCDFVEQHGLTGPDGALRPDMVVHLPGGTQVVIDAKAPLTSYLDACNASDAERDRLLADHARQVRAHMQRLSAKSYWSQLGTDAPDFVVMFLPGESFLAAALQHDPHLLEGGPDQRVLLAGPTTLIALLRAVAYGWRQEQLAEHAEQVRELGAELYARLRTWATHLGALGGNLDRAVESYNRAMGSLESRVLVTARKFPELGVPAADAIDDSTVIESRTRVATAPEIVELDPPVDREEWRRGIRPA